MDTWSRWSLFVYWKWWILVSWSFDIFFVAWYCLYWLRSSAYIDFEVDDCIICLFQWTKNQVCWRRRGTGCKFLLRVWVHQAGCLHLTVLLIYLERKLEDAKKYHETKWVVVSYIFSIFTQITWAKMIQFDEQHIFSNGVGETTNQFWRNSSNQSRLRLCSLGFEKKAPQKFVGTPWLSRPNHRDLQNLERATTKPSSWVGQRCFRGCFFRLTEVAVLRWFCRGHMD